MKRTDRLQHAGPNFSRILVVAILAGAIAAGCTRAKSADESDESAAVNPVMLVTAARAQTQAMNQDLHLLGKTVAARHVIIRAPTAGRVLGLNLRSGDRVHKGQVVAHILNREIEAAQAGLAVARKIDPADG
jgi:multidrug efflux pump subunit AcrA (membrane-fusion protein)